MPYPWQAVNYALAVPNPPVSAFPFSLDWLIRLAPSTGPLDPSMAR